MHLRIWRRSAAADYDQLILFSCREQPDPVDVVLGLPWVAVAPQNMPPLSMQSASRRRLTGYLNEKKAAAGTPQTFLSARLFLFLLDVAPEVNISTTNDSAQLAA